MFSIDSRDFGPVPQNQIIGKVVNRRIHIFASIMLEQSRKIVPPSCLNRITAPLFKLNINSAYEVSAFLPGAKKKAASGLMQPRESSQLHIILQALSRQLLQEHYYRRNILSSPI